MDVWERARMLSQLGAMMTMQRLRCARLAENRVAEYRSRVRAAHEASETMTLEVSGTHGGPSGSYGRFAVEPGWEASMRAAVKVQGG